MPVYALTVAKGGHKLKVPGETGQGPHLMTNRSQMTGVGVHMSMVAPSLGGLLGRPVINETGLDGPFDFKVEWTPDSAVQLPGKLPRPDEPADAAAAGGISIFTAFEDQLGLKLQPKRGPVPVYIIQKIEKPREN
jgi:uncharacterized protein (TIGR03435 family)